MATLDSPRRSRSDDVARGPRAVLPALLHVLACAGEPTPPAELHLQVESARSPKPRAPGVALASSGSARLPEACGPPPASGDRTVDVVFTAEDAIVLACQTEAVGPYRCATPPATTADACHLVPLVSPQGDYFLAGGFFTEPTIARALRVHGARHFARCNVARVGNTSGKVAARWTAGGPFLQIGDRSPPIVRVIRCELL